MSKRSRTCAECGQRFVSADRYYRMLGNGGGVCVRSALFAELCEGCEVTQLREEALYENLRRLEEWTKMPGHSRRMVAAALVKEFDKHELGNRLRRHVLWGFLYEMTGDRKELRKLVEGLMSSWDHKLVVTDPIMGKTAEKLQNGH